MKRRFFLYLFTLSMNLLSANAQTDMTSYVKNPSFENGLNNWTYKSMGTQDNNVFSIKDGNIYVEKWTGRGGSVGSAVVSQTLTELPPGNYELTVAAQNIQEDTPTKEQRGAWIFAENAPLHTIHSSLNKTTVTARDTYKVAFNHIAGTISIGFEAVNATGNWLAVDNFHLTQVGTNLLTELLESIENAEATYGNVTGKESQQLLDAIAAAKHLAVQSEQQPTAEEMADAIMTIEKAIEIYLRANASVENPLDMTSRIVNPSFENDGTTGWTNEGMGTQGNDIFNIKQGNTYVEKWTWRGNTVGDARISQTLTNMPAGRYLLKAAAQNIQEDTPTESQTGAWIYANSYQTDVTVRQDYTLEFVLASNELEIGFCAINATGNWLAVDNFRLLYISDDVEDIKNELVALIALAETLVTQKTNAAAHDALQAAIDAAKAALQNSNSTEVWSEAARNLEAAYNIAEASKVIFARLKAAIDEAKTVLATSQAGDKAEYQAAIDKAQAVYDADTTTDAMAEAAIDDLAEAGFAFRVANGTGTAPTVKTDPRFIRGATWAFGRSTVNGSDLLEQGFCWSESPDPKVTDNRTTEYLNQAGKIYWLLDLKPATVYYMRAYAISKDYAVGYGDVIKFVTVPKGTIGHWYNNGGDEATNDRLNYAINTAMDYYWNNLSSIHDFGITVNYSPGTPTADCSYGGWMRVGESSSYQQIGTIMHEAFHGIGVGTHRMWWDGEMRSAGNRGDWLGDRVTEAVRFWDNSTTAVITGDDMHLWPYGCNGAHEDTHNDNLYCMMGILAQALNEDGLPASDVIGYALPYYSLNHEDGVKYYIKNESEARGLHTSYLVETADHQLQWKQMSTDEAKVDDSAAWYLTFTPKNQYYQLRNAASGYYVTYASGFKTASHTNPTNADNLHLMRGRVDVAAGKNKFRGYYVIHPESSATPPVLIANTNGKTASAGFNIAKSATSQRWLFLTAEDMQAFENGAVNAMRSELAEVIAHIRTLAQTPHTENQTGVDQTLTNELSVIETEGEGTNSVSELSALIDRARLAGMTFLSNVATSDITQPFDLTFMLQNPDFDTDATAGWTTSQTPGYSYGCDEFYETTFNFYQTLTGMPSGTYQLLANAFQRPGSAETVYTQYKSGKDNVTTTLYISNTSAPVLNICVDRQPASLLSTGGWGDDKKMTDGTYVPNCMEGASKYFAKDLYLSSVTAQQAESNATLRVGIRNTKSDTYYWTIFDNFRLHFFGSVAPETITNIDDTSSTPSTQHSTVYTLTGIPVGTSLQGLPRGIYIVGGHKVVVR